MPNPNINRKIIWTGSAREYVNAETLAYINATESERKLFGNVVDSLITGLKSYGLWTKLKFGLLSPVSLTDTKSLIDLKTATTLSNAQLKGTDDIAPTYSSEACPLPMGIAFKNNDYIKTGAIVSALLTQNDFCIAHGILVNVSSATGRQFGASNGTTQKLDILVRNSSDVTFIDWYTTSNNAGRNQVTGITDSSGRWIYNRRTSTDCEIYKNGVALGSFANGGGTQPTLELYLGARNDSGSSAFHGNHICTFHLWFSSLTATERNNLDTILSAYESNLGSLRSLTRNLIWDGNSLSVNLNAQIIRASTYYSFSLSSKRQFRAKNFAVGGNTTAQRLTAYPTGAGLEYSVSYTKNIYVIWEVRNDVYFGATTAQAKINIDALIDAAQTTGFKVVVVCPHLTKYSGNTGRTETQFNLAIDEMVTYLIANAAAAEYVVQITDTDLWVPRSGYASDAAYNAAVASKILGIKYADGTHLTPSGYNSIGSIINTQALSLIG